MADSAPAAVTGAYGWAERAASAWGRVGARERVPLVLVLAVCLSLGFNLTWRLALSGHLGYLSDDFNLILNNTQRPGGSAFWQRLLADEPLFLLYDALRVAVLGVVPHAHHLWLAFLLVLNALLAFLLVWRLSRDALFAMSFLVLFLTLPHRSEAEYWISSPYALLRLWLLASAHLGLAWLERGGAWRYAGYAGFYALAVFTHEAALGFGGIMLVLWLLWTPERRWQGAVRFLAAGAVISAVYLLLRQTHWFGLGHAGWSADRPLQTASVLVNFRIVLDSMFGAKFLSQTAEMMRAGSALGASLLPAAAAILLVLLAVALASEPRQRLVWLLQGILLGAVFVAASGLYADPPAFPQPFPTSHWLLRGIIGLFLAAVVWRVWRSEAPAGFTVARLIPLGLAWYLFAFAVNLVWYVASRHYYIPSVGVALVLAGMAYAPAQLAPNPRLRDLLTGVAVFALALLGGGFFLARRGEASHWVEATRYTRRLETQLRLGLPAVPHHATVVVLDLPDTLGPAPLLPPWGFRDALRLWYADRELAAGTALVPVASHFTLDPRGYPAHLHYDSLLLFTYRDQKLEPVRELILDRRQGPPATVTLANAAGASLRVREGVKLGRSAPPTPPTQLAADVPPERY